MDKKEILLLVVRGLSLQVRLTRKLQQVQNAAARLVSSVSKFDHISPVLACLHWLPVLFWARFKVLVFAYKAFSGLGPHY